MQQDYRGIVVILSQWTELREMLGLSKDKLPNFSTLKYASDRLLKKSAPATCCAAPLALPANPAKFATSSTMPRSTPPATRLGM